jgi:acyl-CoA dehydrogenase
MPQSPWISDDLLVLQEQTARLLARKFVPQIEAWDAAGIVDRQAWRDAGDAGILCASIPEAYGGGGGTLAHEAVVAQELVRAGLGGGFGAGIGVHSAIVARYILIHGTEEQRLRWLPPMAAGELIGAVAMTEPGTGSDLQGITTVARKVEGGYRVSGQKTYISNGQNCGMVITVCKTDTAAGARGISLLVVETDGAEGFVRGRNLNKIGMPAQDTSELFFDDVFVPDANLLGGEEGRGFSQLMNELPWERLSTALGAVINMERAVALTVQFVKDRKVFGKPLFEFQNTQFKLAECQTQAVMARAFVDTLMVRLLNGDLDAATAAMAKWWCTDAQCRIIDECLQLHGGAGYMMEYEIARLWADTRVSRIYAGTNEIMKLIIARSL